MEKNNEEIKLSKDFIDFKELAKINPEFSKFICKLDEQGKVTIDFSDRNALKQLTKSILMQKYSIKYWDLPENYLIPSFTMRYNYLKWCYNLINKKLAKVIDMYFYTNYKKVEWEQIVFFQ